MTARRMTGAVTTVRARTTILLAAVLLPLALSGCGSGLHPQTYQERTAEDAANSSAGNLALRDVAIQPPPAGQPELAAGSDALVRMAVVNALPDADSLTSASSSAASSVDLVDASGQPVPSVQVPGNGSAGYGDFGVELHGLTNALRPGMYVDITFVFAQNGRATLQVPVKLYQTPVPRDSFSAKPEAE